MTPRRTVAAHCSRPAASLRGTLGAAGRPKAARGDARLVGRIAGWPLTVAGMRNDAGSVHPLAVALLQPATCCRRRGHCQVRSSHTRAATDRRGDSDDIIPAPTAHPFAVRRRHPQVRLPPPFRPESNVVCRQPDFGRSGEQAGPVPGRCDVAWDVGECGRFGRGLPKC